ncbi:CU044_2847 family protein [Cylindrospermum sp. FACHB-282]|uniref:CU044_2847 family protein n=1 Tax=Cylindrospermum sp. FACHB-282 TaxID=2692794 RepID=UPI0016890116|nr:CU044_2847 family protein [Cylindrospermum sp. FACHB-282]MBD2388021.1 hypothetical protein [Cylindrospermum sp. FACHB-282]
MTQQLIPIELEDGTLIYIEAVDDSKPTIGEAKRGLISTEPQKQLAQSFQAIQKTVRAYTVYTIGAFKNLAIAEVSEVSLEFGVKVNVSTGVPFIAQGTADCNVKITVKCVFPK